MIVIPGNSSNNNYSPTTSTRFLCSGHLDKEGKAILDFVNTNPASEEKQGEHYPIKRNNNNNDAWDEESIQETIQMWQLTEKEIIALRTLGKRLHDINHEKNKPSDVVRFLRVRHGNVNATEIMFRNMIQWRKNMNADTILDDYIPPNEMLNYFPGAVLQGRDHDGDPIFVSRSGVVDGIGMINKFGKYGVLQYQTWMRENVAKGNWINKYEQEQKRPIKNLTIIDDLHGLPLLQTVSNRKLLSIYGDVMRLDQDNYPESAKRIIIIRAPALFHIVWKVVKYFFDGVVADKMVFVNEHNYQHVLEKYVDLKVLPKELVPGIGQGQAEIGQPQYFHGGLLPSSSSSSSTVN